MTLPARVRSGTPPPSVEYEQHLRRRGRTRRSRVKEMNVTAESVPQPDAPRVVRSRRAGYGVVPHWLWTCDELTPGEFRLLGWLHSHTDEYLAGLSTDRIGREFGCGKAASRHLRSLEEAGFIERHPEPGGATRYVLVMDRWEGVTAGDRGVSPDVTGGVSPNVTATPTTREDQLVEDQVEGSVVLALAFDAFWAMYPRKVEKAKARQRWGRLTEAKRRAAMEALPLHVAAWEQRGDPQFIPHPTTWLNGQRWEDDPTSVGGRPVQPSTRHGRSNEAMARFLNGTRADNREELPR